MNLDLFNLVEKIALKDYGGHYTIYKFTTHYKGVFGTIMSEDFEDFHKQIGALPHYDNLDELFSADRSNLRKRTELPLRAYNLTPSGLYYHTIYPPCPVFPPFICSRWHEGPEYTSKMITEDNYINFFKHFNL